MKRIIEFLRQRRRTRLEQRHLLKATGELPRGWLARLVYKVKAKNHERLARHGLQERLISSIAANDTAMLEAMAFLLETFRQDQRTRSEANEALAQDLAALGDRLESGLRLLDARLQRMELRLPGAPHGGDAAAPAVASGRPASSNGAVNGELKHAHAPGSRVAERVEPSVETSRGGRTELSDGSSRRE